MITDWFACEQVALRAAAAERARRRCPAAAERVTVRSVPMPAADRVRASAPRRARARRRDRDDERDADGEAEHREDRAATTAQELVRR